MTNFSVAVKPVGRMQGRDREQIRLRSIHQRRPEIIPPRMPPPNIPPKRIKNMHMGRICALRREMKLASSELEDRLLHKERAPRGKIFVRETHIYASYAATNREYGEFSFLLQRFVINKMRLGVKPIYASCYLYTHPEDGRTIPRVDLIFPKNATYSVGDVIKTFNQQLQDFLIDHTKTYEDFKKLREVQRKTWIIFKDEE